MGVWLISPHGFPELNSTSSCNMASSSYQDLCCHALQVHRGAVGHTHHMLCSSHQGRLSCRGVSSKCGGDVGGSLQVGSLGSRG